MSARPDPPATLSVVVITKNEEAVIRRCLESVTWAHEIVVVDSGSTDRTISICQELGAKVQQADWRGPATQRNRAIDQATGTWILALDADEWVTGELRGEIEEILAQDSGIASERKEVMEGTRPAVQATHRFPSVSYSGRADRRMAVAYRIPRLSSYCGRYMRHGGWWPDYISRLFRRGAARFEGGIVHDHLVCEGPIGVLRNHLLHEPFTDMTKVLDKLNAYSTWGAQRLHEEGARSGLARAIAHGSWTFFRTYILRAGFLDGREGFLLAVSNAEGTYYKYVKLMLLTRRQ